MVRETCEIQRFKKLLEGAGEDFPLERICFQKAVRAVRRFWPELLLSSSVVVTLVDRLCAADFAKRRGKAKIDGYISSIHFYNGIMESITIMFYIHFLIQ